MAAATHPDYLVEQLLINGGTAGFVSYDGQVFFGAAHESGDSGAQDNDIPATAVDAAAVSVAEFKTAFKAAVEQMLSFNDDRGEPARLTATGLVAIVPRQLLFAATEALAATVINNTSNVLAAMAKPLHLPGLTTGTEWYLAKTDGHVRPFIYQERKPIEFKAVGPGSEEEFRRDKHLYGVRGRYTVAYGEWKNIVRVTFA